MAKGYFYCFMAGSNNPKSVIKVYARLVFENLAV